MRNCRNCNILIVLQTALIIVGEMNILLQIAVLGGKGDVEDVAKRPKCGTAGRGIHSRLAQESIGLVLAPSHISRLETTSATSTDSNGILHVSP